MRALFIVLLLSFPLAAVAASPKASSVASFNSEEEAHIHCPQDTVVWLNPHVGRWYTKKSRHYANDGYGAFVCEKEARKAGYKKG